MRLISKLRENGVISTVQSLYNQTFKQSYWTGS